MGSSARRLQILALLGAGLAGHSRGQVVTEFPVPTAGSSPAGIAACPDGGALQLSPALAAFVNGEEKQL